MWHYIKRTIVLSFLAVKHYGEWHIVSDSNVSYTGATVSVSASSIHFSQQVPGFLPGIFPIRYYETFRPLYINHGEDHCKDLTDNSGLLASKESSILADIGGIPIKLASKTGEKTILLSLQSEGKNGSLLQATLNDLNDQSDQNDEDSLRHLTLIKQHDNPKSEFHYSPLQFLISVTTLHLLDAVIDSTTSLVNEGVKKLIHHHE